jgi:hypothetical protein
MADHHESISIDHFQIPILTSLLLRGSLECLCPFLSCVLLKRVPKGRTESGGIVLAANAGPRVPSDEALYFPTFSHLFDCQ